MFASLLRTITPVIVGILLGWAAKVGFDLPAGAVTEIVTVVLTATYYLLVRTLEQEWPIVGRWLLALGLPVGQPTYDKRAPLRPVQR
jgi:hypothetical protein